MTDPNDATLAAYQSRALEYLRGGPYQGILANAVLLHLSRDQFEALLGRLIRVICTGRAIFSEEFWCYEGFLALSHV